MSQLTANKIIRTAAADNVGIIPNATGLPKGTIVSEGIVLTEDIPMGHKVALEDMPEGRPVIRYGQIIGYTNCDVPKGSWINELNINMPQPPELQDIPYKKPAAVDVNPLTGYTFQGFRNADGSTGTKNVLAITESVQCVAGIANYVTAKIRTELLPRYPHVDGVVALSHNYGCGIAIDAPAAIIPIRTIRNITHNPNFGNETMIVGLGCEKLRPERLLETWDTNNKDTILYLQDESFSGFEEIVQGIMEMAERHLAKLNLRQRETCSASDLVVGMQCGGSDAFSGLTANPVAGFAADLIVRAGGTVMFSEVTEVRDAIHLLVPRAVDERVAQALKNEMSWYDDYLLKGQADRSANTTPGNKRGGLSNIVEKALGSVIKSGTSPYSRCCFHPAIKYGPKDSILWQRRPVILFAAPCNWQQA